MPELTLLNISVTDPNLFNFQITQNIELPLNQDVEHVEATDNTTAKMSIVKRQVAQLLFNCSQATHIMF